MATLLTQTALICKNCSRPMPLPEALSAGVTAVHKNFLCRSCGHVYEYVAGDYQAVDPLEMPQPRKPQHVAYIEITCGTRGCTATHLKNGPMATMRRITDNFVIWQDNSCATVGGFPLEQFIPASAETSLLCSAPPTAPCLFRLSEEVI